MSGGGSNLQRGSVAASLDAISGDTGSKGRFGVKTFILEWA